MLEVEQGTVNLFGFKGTISRTQFWLVTLAGSLAAFLLALPLSWLPQGVLLDTLFLSYLAFLCGFCWVFFAGDSSTPGGRISRT